MGRSPKRHFLSTSRSRSRSRSRSEDSHRRHHKTSKRRHEHKNEHKKRSRDRKRRDHSHSRSRSRSRIRTKQERRRGYSREKREDNLESRYGRRSDVKSKSKEKEPEIEPEKPCFIPSGILAKFTNTVNGVTLKFTEPPDAAVPTEMWRIYPFKGEEALPALHIHRQSCYLIGKDENVADIVVENPTCSSQHAVIQFREIKKQIGDEVKSEVRPYLLDLESKNGTFLNGEKLEPARYYQLLPKDVIKLANSSRDYVIMSG